MPAYWILKTEPSVYSYADLERDSSTVWDGISNNAALKHMRSMQPGDLALIYHTGDERRAVGLAELTSGPYPNPQLVNEKLIVVDVRALRALPRPIDLAAIKADPFFATFTLVREGRLSVVPVSAEQWARLMGMAGEPGP
jgi:predicted RNA-binding protein with PUA-like domain